MTAPIIIEEYDSRWPERFEHLRSRIASTLGRLAAAIEHVGSTAVPGLAAKPVIDLDVVLGSPAALSEAIARLAAVGYQHRGDLGVPGREAFRPPGNDFPHHLYVHPPESREYVRHIVFRDHLRAYPEDARAYERLKRALARQYRDNREAYNQAKTEFVETILLRTTEIGIREHSPPGQRTLL